MLEAISYAHRLFRLEMTLGRVIAFIGWAHDQKGSRGCFTHILPTMGQVSFEEQAIAGIYWIDSSFNCVGQVTLEAINEFDPGVNNGSGSAVCLWFQGYQEWLSAVQG
jgi:hypothetical protein